jgi:hypothetical protein
MIRCTLLSLTLLGLAYGSLNVFRPAWASAIGLDGWNLPAEEAHLAAERRRAADLMTRDQATLARIIVKSHVVQDLLAGRLTLLEAAAQFRCVNETAEQPLDLTQSFPGRTEGERYCRQVLQWSRIEAQRLPSDESADVMHRLEAELADCLESDDGEVILPEI